MVAQMNTQQRYRREDSLLNIDVDGIASQLGIEREELNYKLPNLVEQMSQNRQPTSIFEYIERKMPFAYQEDFGYKLGYT